MKNITKKDVNDRKKRDHEYYIRNFIKIQAQKKEYAARNKEKADAYKRKYVETHHELRLEQSRRYYNNNKDKRRQYEKDNREILNVKARLYKKTHPQARIAHNLRTRLSAVLSGNSNGGRMFSLVGCDMDFLKKYIESLWSAEMDWFNYGRGGGKWSMDHIIPLDNFNLQNEEEQRKAFHYSNMQPMWYVENASKSNRYSGRYKNNP